MRIMEEACFLLDDEHLSSWKIALVAQNIKHMLVRNSILVVPQLDRLAYLRRPGTR